jgi:hypothetical protein
LHLAVADVMVKHNHRRADSEMTRPPCPAARRSSLPLCNVTLLALLALACGGPEEGASAPPEPYARPTYTRLSQTGLYLDFAARRLSSGVEAYEPEFVLWADEAVKERWLRLPPGTSIDTADMNRWVFPIGTRVWKQFSLDGVALETRLIERYGTGREDYWMGSFVWDDAQSDATFVEEGASDLLGTPHDAPEEDQCWSCHNGENGRLLGVSALQLSHAADGPPRGLSLEGLAQARRLSAPPAPGVRYVPPGDELTAAALGYLHANCGHCHNSRGTAWPDTQMVLRLGVDELGSAGDAASGAPSPLPERTELYQSVVGQAVQYFRDEDFPVRAVPGAPQQSALIGRMGVRGPRAQMPPLGTEMLDAAGLDLVMGWIGSLPTE